MLWLIYQSLLSAILYFHCCSKARMLLMAWGRVSCISKTACFPVNYKEPSPQHSLQLWRECGEQSCKALNGYRSLNVANDLGQICDSCHWDCLSQSEAFLPLSPGHSTIKPWRDVTRCIKGSANALSGHLVFGTLCVHFVVGRKRVLSQDLAAASNSKNAFLSFA